MLEEGRACWLPEDDVAELASSLTTSRRFCQSERGGRGEEEERGTPGLSRGEGIAAHAEAFGGVQRDHL